jgi:MFS family permease
MPLWGEFAAKYGSIYTLKITGFLMPMLCFLWPLSILLPQPLNFYFLLGVNFFGGSAWAGFELASSNFLFDASIPERRSLCTAYSNILFGFAVIIGTTVGGLLISNLKISFINVIMFVSLISGIARYTVSFIMTPRLREVREIKFKS